MRCSPPFTARSPWETKTVKAETCPWQSQGGRAEEPRRGGDGSVMEKGRRWRPGCLLFRLIPFSGSELSEPRAWSAGPPSLYGVPRRWACSRTKDTALSRTTPGALGGTAPPSCPHGDPGRVPRLTFAREDWAGELHGSFGGSGRCGEGTTDPDAAETMKRAQPLRQSQSEMCGVFLVPSLPLPSQRSVL